MYREADGPWEMRKAAREQIRDGADFIKIMATGARSVEREDPEPAQMTREEVAAVVDEAHRMGFRVAAHAEGLGGATDRDRGGRRHRSSTASRSTARRSSSTAWPSAASSSSRPCRPSTTSPSGSPTSSRRASSSRPSARPTTRSGRCVAAQAAGVTIAMGYDSGPPGASATELVRLAEAGLGAAARDPGRDLGLGAGARSRRRVGTIEVGKRADLLVVDGDPLADPAILLDPARIWLGRPGRAIVAGCGRLTESRA